MTPPPIDDPSRRRLPHQLQPALHPRQFLDRQQFLLAVHNGLLERFMASHPVIHLPPQQDKGPDARSTRTAQTTGQRILYLEDTGAVAAKNRYSLPPSLQVPKENSYSVLRNEIAKALGVGKNETTTGKGQASQPGKEAA